MEMRKLAFRRRDVLLLSTCAVAILLWLQIHNLDQAASLTSHVWGPIRAAAQFPEQNPLLKDDRLLTDDVNKPANSTLGFGKIIAVSTRTSKRRESLTLSADMTGLEISIPDQPKWTDEDLADFKAKQKSKIGKGSALAWMGHLNALRWFLTQPYDTALILEDDVNWDIHLRNRQAPLLARAFHDVIQNAFREKGFVEYPPKQNSTHRPRVELEQSNSKKFATYRRETYWPSPRYWEILHVGHCGDFFPAKNLSSVHHTAYPDPSMSSPEGLHIDTQRFLKHIPLPKQHRLVHQSIRPLCTFAYAVTKASAARILKEFGTEEENHGTEAYDVRILEACRDLGWKCWSANPELFHHLDDQASEIQVLNAVKPLDQKPKVLSPTAGKKKEAPKKEDKPSPEDIAKAKARGTPNIPCGIRRLVAKMGSSRHIREMVRLASEVDGMCPLSLDELDLMRGQIVEKGRDGLPVS